MGRQSFKRQKWDFWKNVFAQTFIVTAGKLFALFFATFPIGTNTSTSTCDMQMIYFVVASGAYVASVPS